MSYNWTSAATPQGRERLKELLDSGMAVITKEASHHISGDGLEISSKHPDGTYKIHNGRCVPNSQEWESIMGRVYGDQSAFRLEFLDPNPEPEPVKDENGLLPCAHCGGKAEVFGEALMCSIKCSDCDGGFVEVGHSAYKNLKLKWNRRDGKEVNP